VGLCACATPGSRKVGYAVGGAMTVGGIVIVNTASKDDLDTRLDGGSLTVLGAGVLLVTLISEAAYR